MRNLRHAFLVLAGAVLVVLALVTPAWAGTSVGTVLADDATVSAWEYARVQVRGAVRLERRALRAKFTRRVRRSREALERALVSLQPVSDVVNIEANIRCARDKDTEALRKRRNGKLRAANAAVRAAIECKLAALRGLGDDLGVAAETVNDANVPDDDLFRVGQGDPCPPPLCPNRSGSQTPLVNEVWFSFPTAPTAFTPGTIAKVDASAFRQVNPTAVSGRVYRFVIEPGMGADERLGTAFKGLAPGSKVIIDVVSYTDGVQRLRLFTQ